jgi:hypothetical protein
MRIPRLRRLTPTPIGKAPRQWQVDVAVGAALLTVGAGGVLTAVVAAGLAAKPAWCQPWFWGIVTPFGLLTSIGAYMLVAVYVELPLPEPRAAKEAKGQVEIGDVRSPTEEPGWAVIEIPLQIGWRDIDNASINVLVPDYVSVRAADRQGALRIFPNGEEDHTDERLPGETTGSNFWRQSRMHFSAFTAVPLIYRVDFEPLAEGRFPYEVRLYASALQGGIEISGHFTAELSENQANEQAGF